METPMSEPRSLSAVDVARILGVSKSHAYELMRSMPHEQLSDRTIRVREDDFRAWRDSNACRAADAHAEQRSSDRAPRLAGERELANPTYAAAHGGAMMSLAALPDISSARLPILPS